MSSQAQATETAKESPESQIQVESRESPVNNGVQEVAETEQREDDEEEELHPCAYCKKMTLEFCCQDCGEIFYCSEEHAKLHWYV